MKKNPTKDNQIAFYSNVYNRNKGSTMEVSSESLEHKQLRFKKVTGIFSEDDNFSIHDVGMGVADLFPYILENYPEKKIKYSGSEIIPEYIAESKRRFPNLSFYLRDLAETLPDESYDWVVMSGVFHQRRSSTIRDWEFFIQSLLKNSFLIAEKGIAFNLISPFVDFYQPEVYYSNLPKWINFINDELSRFFTIQHDYALFEYTIYVYKEEFIQSKYPDKNFKKYFS